MKANKKLMNLNPFGNFSWKNSYQIDQTATISCKSRLFVQVIRIRMKSHFSSLYLYTVNAYEKANRWNEVEIGEIPSHQHGNIVPYLKIGNRKKPSQIARGAGSIFCVNSLKPG